MIIHIDYWECKLDQQYAMKVVYIISFPLYFSKCQLKRGEGRVEVKLSMLLKYMRVYKHLKPIWSAMYLS